MVKRYSIVYGGAKPTIQEVEREKGPWVKFTDHDAELTALRDQLATAEAGQQFIKYQYIDHVEAAFIVYANEQIRELDGKRITVWNAPNSQAWVHGNILVSLGVYDKPFYGLDIYRRLEDKQTEMHRRMNPAAKQEGGA